LLATPPRVVEEDSPEDVFSAQRAAAHLPFIASEKHPIGTLAHQQVRQYIIDQLEQVGLNADVHETQYFDTITQRAAGVKNILARIRGTGRGDAILLMGHYDSVIDAYGASDNGSAVISMLELARMLNHHPRLQNDVIFLFSDAEEVGLLCVRAFLHQHEWVNNIRLVLNLEARGTSGQSIMFETGDTNLEIVREFAKAVPFPVSTSLSGEIYKLMPNYTDFTAFKEHGFQGLNFAYIDNSFDYHTGGDNIQNTDLRSVQHHGSYIENLVLHLGNRPLDFRSENDAVYFNVFGYGFVVYSTAKVRAIAVFILLLSIIIIAMGVLRKRIALWEMLSGFADTVGLLFLLFVIFSGLIRLVFSFYPGMDVRLLHYNHQGIMLGFSLMTVAFCSFYYYLILRGMRLGLLVFPAMAVFIMILGGDFNSWKLVILAVVAIWLYIGNKIPSGPWNLASGSMLLWIILLMVVSFMVPGASYLFTWPLLAALFPLALAVWRTNGYNQGPLTGFVLLVFAIPVLALFPNLANMFHIAMGLPMMGVTMLIVGLMMSLIIPHINMMTFGRLWGVPAVILTAGMLFVLFNTFNLRYDERYRKMNNMMHITLGDTDQSYWVSLDESPDEWTSLFLTDQPDTMAFREFFPIHTSTALVQQAQGPVMTMPQVRVLADSVGTDQRMLQLYVSVPENASRLVFLFRTGERSMDIFLNDVQRHTMRKITPPELRRIGIAGTTNWKMLPYFAPPSEGITFTIYTDADQQIDIHISAHDDSGIPEFESYSPRPSYMMARGDVTMVGRGYSF
jgi:hypothetical protein